MRDKTGRAYFMLASSRGSPTRVVLFIAAALRDASCAIDDTVCLAVVAVVAVALEDLRLGGMLYVPVYTF
jgi:hypothetical protein